MVIEGGKNKGRWKIGRSYGVIKKSRKGAILEVSSGEKERNGVTCLKYNF